MLLPVVDLITEARLAVDEVIDRAGRGLIETILSMSAEQIAGPSPGKASGEVRWHGRQLGRVKLADRQLGWSGPRLRRKGGGQEAVPAYEALRKSEKTGEEMFEALLKGVSTRNYREVIPEMANSAGVSKSQVSREAAEQGARRLEELLARRWEEVEILTWTECGLAPTTSSAPWAWTSRAASMCWGFNWARPKTPCCGETWTFSPACASKVCARISAICL